MISSCSIVIVNWNSGNQLKGCIDSIYHARKTTLTLDMVVIVDNASSDNSLNDVRLVDLPVKVIKNTKNLGFGRACNIGAEAISSDFILFLNPDTLLYKNTLDALFKYIERENDSNIGIYGIQLQDNNGIVQRTCARFPNPWNFIVRSLGLNKINEKAFQSYAMHEWDHKETRAVDEVMGAFFMVRIDLFRKLIGFDERYFVYYEELDFSKRSCEMGYKTKYITESQAFHKGGGVSEQVKAKRLFYNLQSRMLYSFKHFGKSKGFLIMFITLVIEPFTRLFFLILKRNNREIFELVLGYKMLFKNSLSIIKKGLKK